MLAIVEAAVSAYAASITMNTARKTTIHILTQKLKCEYCGNIYTENTTQCKTCGSRKLKVSS